ncbi:hypothetical protein [Chania multitudinisentens]|uniref:hypothetical protein n=1 Tax=Chania multitudinisentens TaxID=1639108 RepID=UPI0004AFE020|nr:hypothetical protein [Chania multitudinisentens]
MIKIILFKLTEIHSIKSPPTVTYPEESFSFSFLSIPIARRIGSQYAADKADLSLGVFHSPA